MASAWAASWTCMRWRWPGCAPPMATRRPCWPSPAPTARPPSQPQPPPCYHAPAPLPALWVLHLSSFHLEPSTGFEPTAAALLNISQDHLDWHGDMASYA